MAESLEKERSERKEVKGKRQKEVSGESEAGTKASVVYAKKITSASEGHWRSSSLLRECATVCLHVCRFPRLTSLTRLFVARRFVVFLCFIPRNASRLVPDPL